MKLNEISSRHLMSLNLKNWESVKQLQAFLKDNGFTRVGAGYFSQVWKSNASNKVVKISTKKDICWVRYVKWVQQQPANNHLPKIYSFRTYNVKRGRGTVELFVSVLESLEETDNYVTQLAAKAKTSTDIKEVARFLWLMHLDYVYDDRLPNFYRLYGLKVEKTFKIRDLPQFKNLTGRQIVENLLDYFDRTKLPRTLDKAYRDILHDRRCFADLHSGNLMYRPADGSIVIMDPAGMFHGY